MQHQIKFYIKSVCSFLIKKFIIILISVNYKKITTTAIQTDIALYFSFTWQRKLNIHFLDFFFGKNKNLLQCFQGFSSDTKKIWHKKLIKKCLWSFMVEFSPIFDTKSLVITSRNVLDINTASSFYSKRFLRKGRERVKPIKIMNIHGKLLAQTYSFCIECVFKPNLWWQMMNCAKCFSFGLLVYLCLTWLKACYGSFHGKIIKTIFKL